MFNSCQIYPAIAIHTGATALSAQIARILSSLMKMAPEKFEGRFRYHRRKTGIQLQLIQRYVRRNGVPALNHIGSAYRRRGYDLRLFVRCLLLLRHRRSLFRRRGRVFLPFLPASELVQIFRQCRRLSGMGATPSGRRLGGNCCLESCLRNGSDVAGYTKRNSE